MLPLNQLNWGTKLADSLFLHFVQFLPNVTNFSDKLKKWIRRITDNKYDNGGMQYTNLQWKG